MRLFLAGDVMTGRGVDQVLAHPCPPHLYEPYLRSALGYVELAERGCGPIARPVAPEYVWGEGLGVLAERAPDARIVNLETAVTSSEDAWPGKGIHYRMHPKNVGCLVAAGLDCCGLANNHVLDWGYPGLAETLATLRAAGIRTAGAGSDAEEAAAPATIEVPGKGRVLVFALGAESSGVPPEWAARKDRPGVWFLDDLSIETCNRIGERVSRVRSESDLVVVSIHWGGNWGYRVSDEERAFAHRLVDAGVDVVHGHSSHHPRPIELYRGKPILYGCGDLLNDYEGIGGYEAFRPGLSIMIFAEGERLSLVPMRTRAFRLERAPEADAEWLAATLDRESRRFGTRVARAAAGDLEASAGRAT